MLVSRRLSTKLVILLGGAIIGSYFAIPYQIVMLRRETVPSPDWSLQTVIRQCAVQLRDVVVG